MSSMRTSSPARTLHSPLKQQVPDAARRARPWLSPLASKGWGYRVLGYFLISDGFEKLLSEFFCTLNSLLNLALHEEVGATGGFRNSKKNDGESIG